MKISEAQATGKAYISPLNGKTECVAFVKQVTNAPQTARWKKGIQVATARPGSIAKGTAIATFDQSGKYPTDNLGKHAAIYLSHNAHGIQVLDQWASQGKVLKRTIWFNRGPRRSNEGNAFYVIN